MIDKWFLKDLYAILGQHSVAVFIDESGDAKFLLDTVSKDYTIYTADTELEELHVKYLIERQQEEEKGKFLIYTQTSKKDLKFIREYCETSGCLEIRYLQNYIKDKVHQTLNLNINLPAEEIITAAQLSVEKDKTYWMNLIHHGATEIFDLQKELLPFLHDPQKYENEKYDPQIREIFYRKVNELLQQDYISKPAPTLAVEVVTAILDSLALNKPNKTLDAVYCGWLDSVSYQGSFLTYLKKYTLPPEIDIWKVNTSHPFRQVDEKWLKEIGKHIEDKEALPGYLSILSKRIQNKQAKALQITFWQDIKMLLGFDTKDIQYLNSLVECVDYYTKHFYKLDTAIRNLYTEFLNKRDLLEPFQEHYKQLVSIFLDKWFSFFAEYQEEQTGLLQRIIDENSKKTAVIVGDGVAYEIACQIAEKVSSGFKLTEKHVLVDIPSETENNMSRIYMDNGATEKIQANREKYLRNHNPDLSIDCIKLDAVNEDEKSAQFLVCTYKDIDDMGEKLQHKALKYFDETIDYFAEKVSLLFNAGYSKVYLITKVSCKFSRLKISFSQATMRNSQDITHS